MTYVETYRKKLENTLLIAKKSWRSSKFSELKIFLDDSKDLLIEKVTKHSSKTTLLCLVTFSMKQSLYLDKVVILTWS